MGGICNDRPCRAKIAASSQRTESESEKLAKSYQRVSEEGRNTSEEAVIEKLRNYNFKNEEELLAAIGSKAITLGEADKNELRESKPATGRNT